MEETEEKAITSQCALTNLQTIEEKIKHFADQVNKRFDTLEEIVAEQSEKLDRLLSWARSAGELEEPERSLVQKVQPKEEV